MYYNLRQKVVTNCVDRRLLQNAATLVTKCVASVYYKMLQPLLQNAQVITKCVVITKCRRHTLTAENGSTKVERKSHLTCARKGFFFGTTNLWHIPEDTCNVSDCSFWLNLVSCTLYRLFFPLTLPTLQLLTLDFSTALRTPTKHHVNKIIIDRLE